MLAEITVKRVMIGHEKLDNLAGIQIHWAWLEERTGSGPARAAASIAQTAAMNWAAAGEAAAGR
jgi:hypothetical protein